MKFKPGDLIQWNGKTYIVSTISNNRNYILKSMGITLTEFSVSYEAIDLLYKLVSDIFRDVFVNQGEENE